MRASHLVQLHRRALMPAPREGGIIGRRAHWIARLLSILVLASLVIVGDRVRAQEPTPAAPVERQASREQAAAWEQLIARVEEAYGRGQFGPAAELATRSLALAEVAFGPDHPNTLRSLSDLALLYESQGRHSEAAALDVRVLEISERVLGRDHPRTLISVNNLAGVYVSQGHYAEAEPLFLRALEASERVLGREHPDTLGLVTNLAVLYKTQGRYAEAERLYLRALAAYERTLGREHPDTLTAVNNLAQLYRAQGRYAEAERLLLRALETRERVLGREHPDTLMTLSNLGLLYSDQGRLVEAEPLYVRALEAQERALGREHPNTLISVQNLAVLYQSQGRYAEAERLYLRALEASERRFGRGHPATIPVTTNLAGLYLAEGRYSEAEPLFIRALDAQERFHGREHPDTLTLVNNLAVVYDYQRRYAEAEPLHLRALEASERVLGREHPLTFRSVNNLASLYQAQGRYAEAEPLYIRVLEASERALGREHPVTVRSAMNLAGLYRSQSRYAEAERFYLRALESYERRLGREHPDTLTSVDKLAALYQAQGRYAEAEPLFARVLEARERVLGREHPDTIESAAMLAASRLSSAAPASAIGPARLAVASLRSRQRAASSGAFAEAQRGREELQGADYFSLLADAAWATAAAGRVDPTPLAAESFTALQDRTAGTTNRAVVEMAVRHVADAASAGLGALVRERQGLNDQWAVSNTRYSAALAASDANAEAQRQSVRSERIRIEARMDAIDIALRRDFPQYFSLVRPEPLDLAATQAMLAPDEAILMVVPTQFGTHLMAVGRTGPIYWVRSAWTQTEIDGAVRQLLGNIRTAMAGGAYSYDRQTAFQLYSHIVTPVAAALEGKRHVFVVASGSLTSLPFGIFVTEDPQGANDDPQALRTTHWFADGHALIAIPSIQSLQFLRRYSRQAAPTGSPAGAFVGFGNPVLDGPPHHPEMCTRGGGRNQAGVASVVSGRQTRSGGMLASVSLIRTLCPLPGTAAELENMRVAFHAPAASVFGGARSTEHGFRTMDLSHARILALATHGLIAGEVPGASEPGLVFTPPATATDDDDGYLTASEVSALRLDADWVILSACNTAAGDGSAGAPGLSGLARAFFYAGARNLLASHWPVADDAGARLTVRTIQLMQAHPGISRAEALQRAMREVREDPEHPEWAHPGVWAPFSLIGDGAH